MNDINEKVMLAIKCLNKSCKLYEEIPVQEALYENNIFNVYYPRLIKAYTSNLESLFDNYNLYIDTKLNVNSKLEYYDTSYKSMFEDSTVCKLEDDDLMEFLLNLLIAYKCLVLITLSEKDKLDLDKERIIKLKDIVVVAINKHLKNIFNTNDNPKDIYLALDNNVNEFICEFSKDME